MTDEILREYNTFIPTEDKIIKDAIDEWRHYKDMIQED